MKRNTEHVDFPRSEETGKLTFAQLNQAYLELTKDGCMWEPVYDPDAVADARGVLHMWAGEDEELDNLIAKLTDNQAMELFIQLACEDD